MFTFLMKGFFYKAASFISAIKIPRGTIQSVESSEMNELTVMKLSFENFVTLVLDGGKLIMTTTTFVLPLTIMLEPKDKVLWNSLFRSHSLIVVPPVLQSIAVPVLKTLYWFPKHETLLRIKMKWAEENKFRASIFLPTTLKNYHVFQPKVTFETPTVENTLVTLMIR